MKRKTNVLVVDDEKTVCSSCKKILTQQGYDVDVALSGEEALKKFRADGFDVVIADWKMPEIDGIEVARRIKKENPKVVVIMITGYPSVESSIRALRSGVSNYVAKPFTPEELSDAVLRALKKGHAVPTDLVIDRLVEKGALDLEEPKAATTPEDEIQGRPVVTPLTTGQGRTTAARSLFAALLSRFFFVVLGPVIVFTILTGIFKLVFGKRA